MNIPPEILLEHRLLSELIDQSPPSLNVKELVYLPQSDSFGIVVGVMSDYGGGWDCLVVPLGVGVGVIDDMAELFPVSKIAKIQLVEASGL